MTKVWIGSCPRKWRQPHLPFKGKPMTHDMTGKIALITGAAGAIELASASLLAARSDYSRDEREGCGFCTATGGHS